MVNIFLNHKPQGPFFTISRNEVERLSIFPFRWIRYVMFAICGVHGDISMTPNGQPVNYNDTLLEDDAELYYIPSGLFLRLLLTLPTFVFLQKIVTLWTMRH
jgi:hypothetical protein